MGVTRVWRIWQGRGATTDEKGVRTLKQRWGAETDSDLTGEPEVIDSVIAVDPTAALYAPHPNWPWALCRLITADPNGSARVWVVNATYSSAPFAAGGDGSGSSGGDGGGANPSTPSPALDNSTPADQRAPTIAVTRKEITEPLEFDAVTSARIVNTVGDPFDPPAEVSRSRQLITWKFYRAPDQLNWDARAKWCDSINSQPVIILGKTYPPYSLRCVDYSLDTVWETTSMGLGFYYALTAQAEYNPDLWLFKILNTGRQKLEGGKAVAIVDKNGQPVAEPVPLTAAGIPVAPGGVYHYVDAEGYIARDWNGTGGTLTGPGGILG